MKEEIIELLRNAGADAWTLTDTKKHGWEFYFIRHNLDQNRIVDTEHVNVTVYKKSSDGKYLGSASEEIEPTASLEEAEEIIHQLLVRAAWVSNPFYSLRQASGEEEPGKNPDVKAVSADFINMMNDLPETETEDINSYEIFTSAIEKRLVTSNGIDHTEIYPSSMLEVVTNARNDQEEIEMYRLYHSGTCGREALKADITRTLQYGRDRLHTIPTPELNQIPLLLSTSDSLQVYDWFLNRLSARFIVQKYSDWQLHQPVEKDVEGDKVTLYARKYLPNSSCNFTLDEEGAPIRDLCLMKDNVPQNYWGDAMFSSYLCKENTFIVSNYEAGGGSSSEEEIRRGRYLEVVEFSDFQVDPLTGDMFGEIRLGYLHDNGQSIPVTGGSVSGNMHAYMKNMLMSKEKKQYDHALVPSVIKLMNVTVTGVEHEK